MNSGTRKTTQNVSPNTTSDWRLLMLDAAQCAARSGISTAHSMFQYYHQDGRSAPSLSDHSTAHNCRTAGSALCPVVQLQTHSVRLHNQPGGSAHPLPSTVEFRACCTAFNCCDSTAATVQEPCSLQAMNTIYDLRYKLSLSEVKSAVNGGSALPTRTASC
jgi:hypothetical protein